MTYDRGSVYEPFINRRKHLLVGFISVIDFLPTTLYLNNTCKWNTGNKVTQPRIDQLGIPLYSLTKSVEHGSAASLYWLQKWQNAKLDYFNFDQYRKKVQHKSNTQPTASINWAFLVNKMDRARIGRIASLHRCVFRSGKCDGIG